MKTSNERLQEAYLRHHIYSMQFANGLSKQASAELQLTEDAVEKLSLYYGNKLSGKVLTTTESRRLIAEFASKVKLVRSEAWDTIIPLYKGELQSAAVTEAKLLTSTIRKVLPVQAQLELPSIASLRSIATQHPFEGKVLGDWMNAAKSKDIENITSALQTGLVQNDNLNGLVARVMGTSTRKRKDGAVRKAWTGSSAIALTGTSNVQTQARSATLKENQFLISKEYFLATLDGKTTMQCMAADGKIWTLDKGRFPPLHFRCRSLRLPYLSPEAFAERPFNPTTETTLVKEYSQKKGLGDITSRAQLPRGYKGDFDSFSNKRVKQLIGKVPQNVSYEMFLRDQSVDFQNDVLGVTRATLFRKGDIKLDRFVNRVGRTLTLTELEKKGLI